MGKAVAKKLAIKGIEVIIADLNREAAALVCREITDNQGKARDFYVNVADPLSVEKLFQQVNETGGLEMLIHTAAILGKTAFAQEVTDDQWQRMISVSLDGSFYCAREAVRLMSQSGGGRIVLFSSVASLTPTPGALPYSAAKGGVNMLGRTLAAEAAKMNIRVNVIAPGYIATPMLKDLPSGFEEYIIKKTPLKRLGKVEEIAALAAFMASPEADFFTGQILSPNGGLVI
jgi:NAD(P)-dependent dehydrogenase (short-subunit alcohol dehydrogenase family)